MVFIEKNETKKFIVYECITADNCSEVMAKITFLRVSLTIKITISMRLS